MSRFPTLAAKTAADVKAANVDLDNPIDTMEQAMLEAENNDDSDSFDSEWEYKLLRARPKNTPRQTATRKASFRGGKKLRLKHMKRLFGDRRRYLGGLKPKKFWEQKLYPGLTETLEILDVSEEDAFKLFGHFMDVCLWMF